MGNSIQSVDINKELSLRHVNFDQFKRQQSESRNADGENFSQQEEEENVDGVKCIRRRKRRSRKLSPCTT